MNKKLISRLVVFIVGVPAILFLIWLPFFDHIALHVLMTAVTALGAIELHKIFSVKVKMPHVALMTILSSLIPFSYGAYLVITSVFGLPRFNYFYLIPTIAFIFSAIFVLAREVLTQSQFDDSNSRMSHSIFLLFYTGYLISFIQQISNFTIEGKNVSTAYLITFIVIVFLCDSAAWLFGNLFGKRNKGIIKASPNKSIAGFTGGIVGAVFFACMCKLIFKQFPGSWAKIIILGILIGITSIIGDLVESVIKRSSNVKDSGKIILGRGGILDSADSILISAPVYFLYCILFYVNF